MKDDFGYNLWYRMSGPDVFFYRTREEAEDAARHDLATVRNNTLVPVPMIGKVQLAVLSDSMDLAFNREGEWIHLV